MDLLAKQKKKPRLAWKIFNAHIESKPFIVNEVSDLADVLKNHSEGQVPLDRK